MIELDTNIGLARRFCSILSIWTALVLASGFLADTAFSKDSKDRQAESIRIDVEAGVVSAEIRSAPLSSVLAVLKEAAGIRVDAAQDPTDTITLSVSQMPLEAFLARLCRNRALVYEKDPDTGAFRVVRAGAYDSQPEASGSFDPPVGIDSQDPAGRDEQRRRSAAHETAAGNRHASAVETDRRERPLYKTGEILVRFKPDADPEEIEALHRRLKSRVLAKIPGRRLEKVAVSKEISAAQAVASYLTSGIVQNAERHALRYPLKVPNDPLFGEQWGLSRISAPAGWDFTTGSAVVLAVVDSGVDYLHPDLDDNIWVNPGEVPANGKDDDGNGYVDDVHGWDFGGATSTSGGDADPTDTAASGHGTHVAGIAAARGDNGEGVSGTAWRLSIMALKVKADDSEYFELFHVIDALEYARQNGAKIVNCSFGGQTDSVEEQSAFAALEEAGILAVCAAGNGGLNLDAPGNDLYPAEYDLSNIVAVAAGTRSDTLASFSNSGMNAVDVLAPGVSIKSTVATGTVTEASVAVGGNSYAAIGMLYAGTTDADGVAGPLIFCHKGYPKDFPAGETGYIALIERGELFFFEKTENAQNAGAAAVVIYNNRVDDLDQNGGTLQAPDGWIPSVSVTQADGLALKTLLGQPATVINLVPPDAYAYNQGTSMAAPFVSGLAGLLWSKDSSLSHADVKAAILETADKIPALSGKLASGGRINAQGALCLIAKIPGDLNCDGQVGLYDAVYGAQIISGTNSYVCRYCLSTGTDPVGDDKVTLLDVIYLLQDIAGLR